MGGAILRRFGVDSSSEPVQTRFFRGDTPSTVYSDMTATRTTKTGARKIETRTRDIFTRVMILLPVGCTLYDMSIMPMDDHPM